MEYKAVTNKSLKFKGSSSKTGGIKKKKVPKDVSSSSYEPTKGIALSSTDADTENDTHSDTHQVKADMRTPAQRKFDEIRRIREQKDIEKKASMSHRERIESMNTHLSKLTDINDMPKIGPG